MDTCAKCRFWDRLDKSPEAAESEDRYGYCHRLPPVIIQHLIERRWEPEDDIAAATMFPVTHECEGCGEMEPVVVARSRRQRMLDILNGGPRLGWWFSKGRPIRLLLSLSDRRVDGLWAKGFQADGELRRLRGYGQTTLMTLDHARRLVMEEDGEVSPADPA